MENDFNKMCIDTLVNKIWFDGFVKTFLEALKMKSEIELNMTMKKIDQKLYLINRGDWYYKIGVSIDPKARVKQLQTWSNKKLTLENIYTLEDAFKVEQYILSKFTDRINEWIFLWKRGKNKIDKIIKEYL